MLARPQRVSIAADFINRNLHLCSDKERTVFFEIMKDTDISASHDRVADNQFILDLQDEINRRIIQNNTPISAANQQFV